jgi:hypothetical protein
VSSLTGIVEAIALALDPLTLEIDGLQLSPLFNPNPTPPSIDIYPGDPFETGTDFGGGSQLLFVVRARATTADHESGQRCLLRLLDRSDAASVEEALTKDQTLGGVVDSLGIAENGVSGYTVYLDDVTGGGRLIGCEWRVEVYT